MNWKQTQRKKGNQIGDDGAVEVGRNAENQREEDKIEGKRQQRYSVRQQRQKAAEGGGNALASLKVVAHGEDVSENRCGKNQTQPESGRRLAAPGKIEPDREEALENIAEQGEGAAEKSTLQKGIGGSGVLVAGAGSDVLVPKEPSEQAGKEDASKAVAKQDKKQLVHHGGSPHFPEDDRGKKSRNQGIFLCFDNSIP